MYIYKYIYLSIYIYIYLYLYLYLYIYIRGRAIPTLGALSPEAGPSRTWSSQDGFSAATLPAGFFS